MAFIVAPCAGGVKGGLPPLYTLRCVSDGIHVCVEVGEFILFNCVLFYFETIGPYLVSEFIFFLFLGTGECTFL